MTKNKVVVRFKDKTLLKGQISNFSPFYNFFQVELLNVDSAIVNIDKIKAMFFVKKFEGNKEYKYKNMKMNSYGLVIKLLLNLKMEKK